MGLVHRQHDIVVDVHCFSSGGRQRALHDGEDYWGLKYAVSTSFSLDLARLSVEKRMRRVTKLEESPSFLLVKNPLRDLTGADEEIDSLIGILKEEGLPYRQLKHEEATQPAFVEARAHTIIKNTFTSIRQLLNTFCTRQ